MMRTVGLFDIQVNGFAGVDFNRGFGLSASELDRALEAMLATGVTNCLPTLITAPFGVLTERFEALDQAVRESRLGPLMVPGYHLEGPFLNPGDGFSGCHPVSAICPPDAGKVLALDRLLSRPILLVTYAPEFDEGEHFARTLFAAGKLLAMGHSAADFTTVGRAAESGLRLSTHLGNGVPQTLPKLDNVIFSQLACDSMFASFIADGVHIPRHVLQSLVRAKGLERSILTTDAVSAAAMARPGLYPFAGFDVERTEDGSVRIPGSKYLAGSSLTLDCAIRNVVDWNIASFEQALDMSSKHPRKLLAPFLALHNIQMPDSELEWDERKRITSSRIGDAVRHYPT